MSINTKEKIIKHTDLAQYFKLRKAGWRVAWVGNGLICFVS